MSESPTETSKPKPSRQRKWLKRGLVLLIPFGFIALFACTIGWSWINQFAVRYAETRLDSQVAESAQQLPEIVDHEELMRQEITGTNGWDEMMAARARWAEQVASKRTGEFSYEPQWIDNLGYTGLDSREGWAWLLRTGREERYFNPNHFAEALRLTAPVAESAVAVADCDCIVRVKQDWGGELDYRFPSWADYIGLLVLRVRMLQSEKEFSRADAELILLMRILSKHTERFCKHVATSVHGVRNTVLADCVIPMLEEGLIGRSARQAILRLRWQTVGNDPKLWLNNASYTYAWIAEIKAHGFETYWGDGEAEPPQFPRLDLHAIPALTELMEVCTGNAIDAREGRLNLRDADWVAGYESRFNYGYHPIHDVVG